MNAQLRWLPLVVVLACKQDVQIAEVEARLTVDPELIDVATRVGQSAQVTVEVFHERGTEVEIRGISVSNVQGTAFSAPSFTAITLSNGESLPITFDYDPTEAGFHTAALTIRTNAVQGNLRVTARGRASVPELEVFPAAIDFGPLQESGTTTVRIDNLGFEPVVVDGVLSDPRFTAVGLPAEVPADGFVTLPVRYHPLDTALAEATLSLTVGTSEIATVDLRVNDCAHGDRALYDQDGDGFTGCAGDCDDTDPSIRPGAAELHNGEDEDCDGDVDEGTPGADADADGFCIATPCAAGVLPGDCHDDDANVFPGAVEIPGDGVDNDCDGHISSGSIDADLDGFDATVDCNDAAPTVHPGAPELIDGVDQDCDGLIDEGTAAADDDHDGYCEQAPCAGGATGGDCDDSSPTTYPGAPEQPDFVDNDCDGTIDEGTDNEDEDGDGFTPSGGDCDDTDASISPAAGNCP